MATIKIKRGLHANLPVEAADGELLFTTDRQELWVGKGTGQPLGKLTINVDDLQSLIDGKISSIHTHTFDSLTSRPTTLSGYGITDAASSNHTHPATAISFSNANFTSSDVSGALNELFQSADNGKKSIANAIGIPASSSDTFSDLAGDITDQKTSLATKLTNISVSASNTETLKQLVDKVDNVRTFREQTKFERKFGELLSNPSEYPSFINVGESDVLNGASFSPDGDYVSFVSDSSPFIHIYKRNGDMFTKLANPTTLPTGTGYGVSWSPDGVYMSVAHSTSPFITIYKRSGDTFTKLTNPSTLPTGTGVAVAWSSDGTYMSIAHLSSPFVTIYKRNVDTFTKLSNPETLPTGTGNRVAWSPDGVYMSVAHNSSPFITIYKRSVDTFTKLANPTTLPTGWSNAVSWSSDGTYMSIAHLSSPFITIYKRSGDTFTKLDNPAVLPTDTGRGVAWSPDGTYMSVAHVGSPFVTIYKRNGDTFTKLANPAVLPTDTGRGVSWSSDGIYQIVASSGTINIQIYKRDIDTFNSLNFTNNLSYNNATGLNQNIFNISNSSSNSYVAIANRTAGTASFSVNTLSIYKKTNNELNLTQSISTNSSAYYSTGVSWSPDETYLVNTISVTPFVRLYKRSGDTVNTTPLTTSQVPAASGIGNGVCWHPNNSYFATAIAVTPFIQIYKNNGSDSFSLLNTTQVPAATNDGNDVAWSPDTNYVALAHATTPFITIYKNNGDDTFTRLTTSQVPAAPGTGNRVRWSKDGKYVALAHATTPFVTIYKNNGDDTFTRLSSIFPTSSTANDVAWHPNGLYLAVGHDTSPFLTIYKRYKDSFVKLDNVEILPKSNVDAVEWSNDGKTLYVGIDVIPGFLVYNFDQYEITLNSKPNTKEKLAVMPLRLVEDNENVTLSTSNFNNSDAGNFTFSTDVIEFSGGFMQIRSKLNTLSKNIVSNGFTGGSLYSVDFANILNITNDCIFSNNKFGSVDFTTIPNDSVDIGLGTPQNIVRASGNITLGSSINSIESVRIVALQEGVDNVEIAVSFDSGATYKAWDGDSWETVVITNTTSSNSIKFKGMNTSVLENVTSEQWESARNGSSTIRFAYYLNRPNFTSANAQINTLTLNVNMAGTFSEMESGVDYTYDSTSGKITLYFDSTDSYKINYLDTL